MTADRTLVLKGEYPSLKDLTELGYALTNSSEPVSLALIDCIINSEAVDALLAETEERPLSLRLLHYESQNMDLESVKKLLTHQQGLEQLRIKSKTRVDSSLDDYSFSEIVRTTAFASLSEFCLTNIQVGSKTLTNILLFCRELKSLTLKDSMEEDNIEALLGGILKSERLESVTCSNSDNVISIQVASADIDSIDIPPPEDDNTSILYMHGDRDGTMQLLRFKLHHHCIPHTYIKFCCGYLTNVITLALYQKQNSHSLHDESSRTIAECISDFSTLERIALQGIRTDNAVTILASKLILCSMLVELDLANNNNFTVSEDGVAIILAQVKKCSSLQKVVLSGTSLKLLSTRVLASCFCHWPNLQVLYLRGCAIQGEKVEVIGANLKHCTKLMKLDLHCNNITTDEAKSIADNLRYCTELTLFGIS